MKLYRKITFFISVFILPLAAFSQQKVEQWQRFELSMQLKAKPNTAVKLQAVFSNKDTAIVVSGFYDGEDTYRIRFMPVITGKWSFVTKSNYATLNNKKGSFECIGASNSNHGIVRVANTFGFKYFDGTNYYPFGTTAYAWTNMSANVQEMTLQSLKASGFNKLRMCVFPKNYDLVKEEPELFPFKLISKQTDIKGNLIYNWDFNSFNPAYFQLLEKRIDNLAALGIQADLILFHPYDKGRWGFDAMPRDVNLRYVEYLIARLGSFQNVWWSLANEWDYVKTKTENDWKEIVQIISKTDPYKHLCSIHGSTGKYFDYNLSAFTHLSIQDETPVQNPGVIDMLRNIYHKPIICDEVGYEGNLKNRWGRYSADEMTHLVWNGIMGGGFVTHGECYMFSGSSDTIFWAKGGEFRGQSWKRIAFLRNIIEEIPAPLSLADPGRDNFTASAGENFYLIYFGNQIIDSWMFNLPAKNKELPKLKAGKKFKAEIIDTWDMTITPVQQIFETSAENDYRLFDKDLKKIRLPLKSHIALRITEIK